MEIESRMVSQGLIPVEVDQHGRLVTRDQSIKKKKSFRRLFSVSRSGNQKAGSASPILVSPDFPPAVIAAHAITSDRYAAERAMSEEPQVRGIAGSFAAATERMNYSALREHQTPPPLREKSPARASRFERSAAEGPRSRSSSHARSASHGDIMTKAASHNHSRTMSEDQALRGGPLERMRAREPHARTLSESSVVVGEDGKISATSSRCQSPRLSGSSPQSQRARNFSRPSGDHSRTGSVEETSPGSHPAARPRRPTYSTRPPVANLWSKQSYDALLRKRSLTNDTIMEGSTTILRPSTACADSRPSLSHEPLDQSLKAKALRSQADGTTPPSDQAGWRAPGAGPQVRDSGRSIWSARSSGLESSITKHSSVFTKVSVRDSTTTAEMSDGEQGKMVVEDEMVDPYTRGVQSDSYQPHHIRMSFLHGHDIDLRSSRIAEAMNDDIAPARSLKPQRRPIIEQPQQRDPSHDGTFQTSFARPPQLRETTATHDQYGFRKATRDVSEVDFNIWHRQYSMVQNRRTSRWVSLMKNSGIPTNDPVRFPYRSEKVQRYVRKGVPPMWRGAMWFFYAGGQSYLDKFPDLYSRLVMESTEPQLTSSDKEAIDRDLNRTFPDNIHFKPDPPLPEGKEAQLLSALRRVLYAFAVHHPKIGYCQSLNFIAGMLLLFLDEEKAFWMLHIITARYLPGTHEVSLEGANIDIWVLMLALKEEMPKVWNKIGGETSGTPARLPPVSLCTTPWFMSLFIGTVPVETVLRIWDMLFYDGSTVIFRAAMAIFRIGESEILKVQDPMETFQVVQTVPRRLLDAATLVTVTNRKGCVGSPWIEQKRKERKEFYAREREAEKDRKQSREGGNIAPVELMGRPMTASGATTARNLSTSKSMAELREEPAFKGVLSKKPSKGVLTKRPPSRKGRA